MSCNLTHRWAEGQELSALWSLFRIPHHYVPHVWQRPLSQLFHASRLKRLHIPLTAFCPTGMWSFTQEPVPSVMIEAHEALELMIFLSDGVFYLKGNRCGSMMELDLSSTSHLLFNLRIGSNTFWPVMELNHRTMTRSHGWTLAPGPLRPLVHPPRLTDLRHININNRIHRIQPSLRTNTPLAAIPRVMEPPIGETLLSSPFLAQQRSCPYRGTMKKNFTIWLRKPLASMSRRSCKSIKCGIRPVTLPIPIMNASLSRLRHTLQVQLSCDWSLSTLKCTRKTTLHQSCLPGVHVGFPR